MVYAFALIFAIIMLGIILGGLTTENDDEKWPPISDEQFLAKCSPGVRPEVALKVRRIVAEHMGVDVRQIHPEMHFIRDLGW